MLKLISVMGAGERKRRCTREDITEHFSALHACPINFPAAFKSIFLNSRDIRGTIVHDQETN
jgi:hypothetical protein|tara:strand:+ start:422 stop:607 length:186 start_codon:yes stop_codon:yes gene_type:complete